ncbi:MAG: tRNA (5-methylaminomethyl-2-thiouridine)(34)-methyltransferase MnmD [Paracoccaceae bacterium]
MTTGFQHPDIDWLDGITPIATRFDDPYFSLAGGLAETEYVFLSGNDLPARFRPGFHIAELGFGTGLNMLAALIAWRAAGQIGPLTFTSFEAFPLSLPDTRRALAAFPAALAAAEPLFDQWPSGRIRTPDLDATIILGDARETLPAWNGAADAWFLDGFSPAKNPELWSDTLMLAVGQHTNPHGTCASYTAAGHVRRALTAAGFTVTRKPGFGTKRHMTSGWRN